MSGPTERQAAGPLLPTSCATDTIPSGAANTGGISLASHVDYFVTIRCTADCHLRASEAVSTASTATAGDLLLPANERMDVLVTKGTQALSVYGDAAGTLYVARSSG